MSENAPTVLGNQTVLNNFTGEVYLAEVTEKIQMTLCILLPSFKQQKIKNKHIQETSLRFFS